MRAHHILMVKRDNDGTPTEGKEVPNNEWAKMRRTGWEFATPEEVQQWNSNNARNVADAESSAANAGSIESMPGGYFQVTLGELTEKVQGRENADAKLGEFRELMADDDESDD